MPESVFGTINASSSDEDEIQILEAESSTLIARSSENNDEEAPVKRVTDEGIIKDRYYGVYIAFYICGISSLLPWNFLINAESFWNYKFRSLTSGDSESTDLKQSFWSYLSIASNVPMSIFVVLNAIFGQRFHLKYRIILNLIIIFGLFSIISVLAIVNTDSWRVSYLKIVLTIVVFMNVGLAIFQGGVYGIAGKFPPEYMGSVVAGGAVGGIFPSIVNIIVVAIFSESENKSVIGFTCFIIASIFLLITLVAFISIKKSFFFRFYNGHESEESSVKLSLETFIRILLRSRYYTISVFIIFSVTLVCFPAVVVQIQTYSENQKWQRYFIDVACFLLFNIMDFFGRLLSSKFSRFGRHKKTLLFFSLLRIIFIPAFMLCNVSPKHRKLPVLFHSDTDYYVIMILFGLSNGFLGGLAMIAGPKTFDEPELQEATGMVMVAFLCFGTAIGSLMSFPVVKWI